GRIGLQRGDVAMGVAVDHQHRPAGGFRNFGPAILKALLATASMELDHDRERAIALRLVEVGGGNERGDALLERFAKVAHRWSAASPLWRRRSSASSARSKPSPERLFHARISGSSFASCRTAGKSAPGM